MFHAKLKKLTKTRIILSIPSLVKRIELIISLTPITKYLHQFYSEKTRWLNNKHET